ncbi:hypothetical protein Glove_469g25 [Diversispora epigaea]|uniref:Uncharacterized protein n=1 Tax=Diversispora epigaea TaxID=1348612 RepID=A0A397GLQ4_9GLOM|nr:hypothetical protein Glove_469g25 [Diversispora epigaea]
MVDFFESRDINRSSTCCLAFLLIFGLIPVFLFYHVSRSILCEDSGDQRFQKRYLKKLEKRETSEIVEDAEVARCSEC